MLFPHACHAEMRAQVEELRKPNGKSVFNLLMKQVYKAETQSPATPKIGYALLGRTKIQDEGVKYLMDVRFNKENENDPGSCELCGAEHNDKYHMNECKKQNAQHIKMHNLMSSYLISCLSEFKAKFVCVRNNNVPRDPQNKQRKPDVALKLKGQTVYLDVGFTKILRSKREKILQHRL